MISTTENSTKFQKIRFLKEESVEHMVITLGPTAQATLVIIMDTSYL